jgi:thiol-disulfide isomerase/thioredoxin
VILALAVGLALALDPAAEIEDRPDLVQWRCVGDGEAESRATERPVLYFFTADWCPPCAALKRTVFSDPAVAELIEQNFVPVEVDDVRDENQERSPEVAALAFRYLVGRIPTLVVTRPDGGPAVSEEGVPVYSRMVSFLRTARERLDTLERSYGKGPKGPS